MTVVEHKFINRIGTMRIGRVYMTVKTLRFRANKLKKGYAPQNEYDQ